MSNYFNSITNLFSYNSKASANQSTADLRTFEQKVTEAATEEFVYMNKASECPDLKGVKSNDHLLATPAGQLFNAKGEFANGLGHVACAAGNTGLAVSHAVALAANLHNAFAVVTNVGGFVNEAKDLLGAGVEAKKLLQKAQDAYDRLTGNPVKPNEPTTLDHVYNFVKQTDNIFHENTGYLTGVLSAVKAYFYPDNLVGFFSRSGKAVTNAFQAIKCEVNAAIAVAKAGYYTAKDVLGYSEAQDDFNEAFPDLVELQPMGEEELSSAAKLYGWYNDLNCA